jgi:hypothetical protein
MIFVTAGQGSCWTAIDGSGINRSWNGETAVVWISGFELASGRNGREEGEYDRKPTEETHPALSLLQMYQLKDTEMCSGRED